jgi:purine-nucleoside phosphorylase
MGDNALIGQNLDRFGDRFPGMIHAYDEKLGRKMVETAISLNIPHVVGTYAAVKGPSYETRGEMRALIRQGADAVGMSTIQETITANHCTKRGRMKVVGVSVVTDMCKPDNPEVVSEELVIASAHRVAPQLGRLLTTFIKQNKF